MIRALVHFLLRLYFRVVHRMRVEGLGNIPKDGPLIIACNHLSNADPPIVVPQVETVRPVTIIAKKELFGFPPLGAAFRHFGAIPVDRGRGDVGAFKAALGALKGGGCLVIFPEGTRALGRKLEPKQGVAMLAHRTGAPVLCARVINSENFSKLGKITLRFGGIRRFPAGEPEDPKLAYQSFSRQVMEDIFAL